MTNCLRILAISGMLLAVNGVNSRPVRAQEEDASQKIVTRAYRVDDLLRTANDYWFDGIHFPGMAEVGSPVFGGGFGNPQYGGKQMGGGVFRIPAAPVQQLGGGTGGGTGGGGFGGGGGFQISDEQPQITISDLENVVESILEQADDYGEHGEGINVLGHTLIVRARVYQHEIIEDYFQLIRQNVTQTSRSVTIAATWLLISDDGYAELGVEAKNGVRLVDRKKLDEIAKTSGATGTITCFDSQTVHIVSGNVRNWLKSVQPIVGSNSIPGPRNEIASAVSPAFRTVLASNSRQDGGDSFAPSTESNIGYQPVISSVNYGAMLQVTPMLVPDAQSAIIDVHSNVVLPADTKTELGSTLRGGLTLDRLNVQSHQFRSSLRVPLNQPTLVGGSAMQIGKSSLGNLYVVLEVVADQ